MVVVWGIVIAYLAVTLGLGFYARTRVKSSEDYLVAGRRLGVVMFAGTLAATEIGGGSSVGVAAKAFGNWGLSAFWYVVCAGIGIILVAFVAPFFRKTIAVTVPEIINQRFGTPSYVATSILSLLSLTVLAAVQIIASSTILHVLTGMPMIWALILSGLFVTVYTYVGGMWSVTITDFVHFFFTVFGFAIAALFALHRVGGWGQVVAHLPKGHLTFDKIGWETIVGLIVLYFMTFSTGQEAVQRYFTAKDDKTAVYGSFLTAGLMALYAFVPAILGLIALSQFPDIKANDALATTALRLTPVWVAGLALAAVISCTQSAASGDLLGAATVLTRDLYKAFVKRDLDDAATLRATRRTVLGLGVLATLIALNQRSIIPLLIFAFTMRSAGPFAAFIFGLFWKSASRNAGIWSIAAGSVMGFVWDYLKQPYGIMSVIAGSVVGSLVFVTAALLDRNIAASTLQAVVGDEVVPESGSV